MKVLKNIPFISAVLLGILSFPAASGLATSGEVAPSAARAYAIMDDGDIAGCAIEVRVASEDAPVAAIISVRRSDSGNLFKIEARADDAAKPGSKLTAVRLKTPTFDSAGKFKLLDEGNKRHVAATALLDATEGAILMQSLTVLGADMTVDVADGRSITVTFPRPFPQSVRSVYLNCAGDLYRP